MKRLNSLVFFLALSFLTAGSLPAADLPETIVRIKPSVVGIATLNKLRVPSINFIGTGFVIKNGLDVITNAHVVKSAGAIGDDDVLGILTGSGGTADFRPATIINFDNERDLAHLKIGGAPLPPLKIGDSDLVKEGQTLAFTGFPIGVVLGFHHATHRAMVSSITPISMPAPSSRVLNPSMITQLKNNAYQVFQLDGTAYPGNSGSPLYDPESGEVLGVINKVFVKGTKEAALSQPSGITYAIPSNFIRDLLDHGKQ